MEARGLEVRGLRRETRGLGLAIWDSGFGVRGDAGCATSFFIDVDVRRGTAPVLVD